MVILTGPKGLIGRAVSSLLDSHRIDYIPIDRLKCDLANQELSEYILAQNVSDSYTIIHLAAVLPYGSNTMDLSCAGELTKAIDSNVARCAKRLDAKVVYASSLSVYDRTTAVELTELSPTCASTSSPYLRAKLRGEDLFSDNSDNTILRLPAPIAYPGPKETVLHKFISSARDNKPIYLWGGGQRKQNYVDVSDIASAFIHAFELPVNGIYNIASSFPISMLELATVVVNIFKSGTIEFCDRNDPLEYQNACYCTEKASKQLSWRAKMNIQDSIYNLKEAL
jgi:UDP-glucose 4-epimerase